MGVAHAAGSPARAIANREDASVGGAHTMVHDDTAFVVLDPAGLETEVCRPRRAPDGDQEMRACRLSRRGGRVAVMQAHAPYGGRRAQAHTLTQDDAVAGERPLHDACELPVL